MRDIERVGNRPQPQQRPVAQQGAQGSEWGQPAQLRKTFLGRKRCHLQIGSRQWEGVDAEDHLAQWLGFQFALKGASHDQIRAIHAKALELGGADEGAPGWRGPEGGFFGAYFRDPDGNKLCVCCHDPA